MKTILDEQALSRVIRRLAMQISEGAHGKPFALVGIRTRGVILARRIGHELARIEGMDVPLGILDIALYRDDLLLGSCDAVFKGSEMDFEIDGKNIVLCDDVLYTGRTVRAALSALAAMGRADSIRLACLADRGHRELPFSADYIGKNIPTARAERVLVHFRETDGEDGVFLVRPEQDATTISKETERSI